MYRKNYDLTSVHNFPLGGLGGLEAAYFLLYEEKPVAVALPHLTTGRSLIKSKIQEVSINTQKFRGLSGTL